MAEKQVKKPEEVVDNKMAVVPALTPATAFVKAQQIMKEVLPPFVAAKLPSPKDLAEFLAYVADKKIPPARALDPKTFETYKAQRGPDMGLVGSTFGEEEKGESDIMRYYAILNKATDWLNKKGKLDFNQSAATTTLTQLLSGLTSGISVGVKTLYDQKAKTYDDDIRRTGESTVPEIVYRLSPVKSLPDETRELIPELLKELNAKFKEQGLNIVLTYDSNSAVVTMTMRFDKKRPTA